MLAIETSARAVVAAWEKGDLAATVRTMAKQLDEISREREAFADQIAIARRQTDDELEIDDGPIVSVGDAGVWVQAWVWVPIEDEEED